MKNDNFETSLKAWNENEKAANELINIVGKLWYDKSVELIMLRSLLVNRGSGKILNKHLRAEAVMGKPVRVQDSLLIAKALLAEIWLPPVSISAASIRSGRNRKQTTITTSPLSCATSSATSSTPSRVATKCRMSSSTVSVVSAVSSAVR